jgi:3-isopropylmalate/(R)-2-methylmalate dehydratase small subunit
MTKIYKLGDNINTDYIISGRYKFSITDPNELAKHIFEDLDSELSKKIKEGDYIVAGENFGCGSSREQAPLALKTRGIKAVIAKSFVRIFYRNAINLGLLVIEANTDEIKEQDEIEIDFENYKIKILNRNKEIPFKKIPKFLQEIIKEGGVVEYIKKNGEFEVES